MINLTWKVFSLTGNIDSYLLFKEVERDGSLFDEKDNEFEFEELDPPAH
ncbi:YqzL family protein [Evansella sp. LMS18]|nr:YqzL family protein [Evansella sp. LMS18]UTR09364.1 YqzL family protein [Evansella sp. LMS18]